MFRHRSVVSVVTAALLLAVGCLLTPIASAQDLVKQVPSLKWIPANAGTYSAMLRNREQIDIVLNSKAVAKLMSLPMAQEARKNLEKELTDPFSPFGEIKKWYNQPGNAMMVQMLGDLASDEIFLYADKNCAEFAALFQDVYSTVQMAPFTRINKGGLQQALNDPNFQARVALQSLSDNIKKLRFPDFVIGFRLTRTRPAEVKKTIDEALKLADMLAPPPLQGRLKKTRIHGSEVNTLVLDGSLVPWENVPWAQYEERPGQFDKLRKKLKEMQMTFAVGVRDDYLLFSFGDGTAGLQALTTTGRHLTDLSEFLPVVKHGDRRITSLSYTSKEYRSIGTDLFSGGKIDDSMKYLDGILRETELTPVQQAKIRGDLRGLLTDVERSMPIPGAQLDFSFLSNRGMEGFSYDWSKNHGLEAKTLTILDHVGGQPIAFSASHTPSQMGDYAMLVKYLKMGYGYFEEYAVPQMPPDEKAMYHKVMKQAMPLITRLDKATGKMLLPSVDGQGAFVLDGRLKLQLPLEPGPGRKKGPGPLPVPELGVSLGLSNARLFTEAMSEYREVYNGAIDIVNAFAPKGEKVAEFKIPLPKTRELFGTGKLYSWPLPKVEGLDPKVMPTGGISDKVAVFGASEDHAMRLLKKTPFKMDGGPLGNTKRPLVSADYLSWSGLIDTLVVPWADAAMEHGNVPPDIAAQARTVMDVLKVFRSYATATYLEQGAVVVHGEAIFRDLER